MSKPIRRGPGRFPKTEPEPVHPPGTPEPPGEPPLSPSPDLPDSPRINPDIDPDLPDHTGPPLSDPETPH